MKSTLWVKDSPCQAASNIVYWNHFKCLVWRGRRSNSRALAIEPSTQSYQHFSASPKKIVLHVPVQMGVAKAQSSASAEHYSGLFLSLFFKDRLLFLFVLLCLWGGVVVVLLFLFCFVCGCCEEIRKWPDETVNTDLIFIIADVTKTKRISLKCSVCKAIHLTFPIYTNLFNTAINTSVSSPSCWTNSRLV